MKWNNHTPPLDSDSVCIYNRGMADSKRSIQAAKAGSVTSEKKSKQSALNLAVAREKKRVVLNLGMSAYDKVVELGLAEYRKTQAALEA